MALTPCGCTQLLEPDPRTEFTICDNAGSPAFTESGLTPIPTGASTLTVSFAAEKASDQYTFIEMAVQNLVDSDPLLLNAELISGTTASFRVALSGATDSANYQLRWSVYVRSI